MSSRHMFTSHDPTGPLPDVSCSDCTTDPSLVLHRVDDPGVVCTPAVEPAFDTLGFIMDFEGGEISEERLIEGFQHLVNTGMAWRLQGLYGRTAMALIEHGLVTRPKEG